MFEVLAERARASDAMRDDITLESGEVAVVRVVWDSAIRAASCARAAVRLSS